MERRFKVRLSELRKDAEVHPAVFREVFPRLERFVKPFAQSLRRQEQETHLQHYLSGLLSDVENKNVESIAYHHDEERQGLQKFIGQLAWDHQPLLQELARQVGVELGEADGVLVIDPSAFPKSGTASVGVQRQWCGRLGKIDNCQVGIYLGYASRCEHALVDLRLYLPQAWAKDKKRRQRAGVPKHVRFRTRQELALEMLAAQGAWLPHAWVAGDDEMGRSSNFGSLCRSGRSSTSWPCLRIRWSATGTRRLRPTAVTDHEPRCLSRALIAGRRRCRRMPGRRSMCGMGNGVRWWSRRSRHG